MSKYYGGGGKWSGEKNESEDLEGKNEKGEEK